MKPTPISDIAHRLGGTLNAPPLMVTGFATDSGKISAGDLFLAIKGARVDGHDFVPQALAAGAVAAVVERPVDGPHILVENLVAALARMAASFRASFDGPVIGITGSAGKTTTKEFVAAALSPLGSILKNEGNRNTEFTSPLLWNDLEPDHRAVIVEMAMRGFDQIRHLTTFARPTVGIVTNIGFSHLMQVGSREGIAHAKGELLEALPADGQAILWQDDPYRELLTGKVSGARIRTFGHTSDADCAITDYAPLSWESCRVVGRLGDRNWEATLPAVGRHIALNAAAAVLAADSVGVDVQAAAEALGKAQLPPMRMEVREHRGASILLDTYNAAPPSMVAAIETLAELPTTGRKRAVVGEMKELGEHTESAHRMVGRALAEHGIADVCFYGEPMGFAREEALSHGLSESGARIATSIEDVRAFLAAGGPGDAVLVKGSRALELERALD